MDVLCGGFVICHSTRLDCDSQSSLSYVFLVQVGHRDLQEQELVADVKQRQFGGSLWHHWHGAAEGTEAKSPPPILLQLLPSLGLLYA